MKKTVSLILGCLFWSALVAQVKTPVTWSFAAKKTGAAAYELQLTAQVEDEWHIYSQSTPEGGPAPTAVSFSKNPLLTYNGAVKEQGRLEQHFEELFGVNVKQYSGKVVFTQSVVLKAGIKTAVNGSVEYMACNDHECMPPQKQAFSIAIK